MTLFWNDETNKTCWQRNEHRNLMHPNREQWDTISLVCSGQIFLRWTWLFQCLLKKSAMCGLEPVPFIYTKVLSKEAWLSISPQNWSPPQQFSFQVTGGYKSWCVLSVWPGMDHKYFVNYLSNLCDCNWWKLHKLKNWKVASNPSFPTQLGKGDGWAERNPELLHFAALICNPGLWGNINLSLPLEEKAARYLFAMLCHL